MFDLSRLGHWDDLPFFTETLPGITSALARDPRPILPPPNQIFAALERTQPDRVRAVILGQDPYPTPGHAHGFAFSIEPDVKLPRSLANIFAEMRADIGGAPASGDLRGWADQGVLLLNTILTVPAGHPNGHRALGWQHLTAQILERLSDRPRAFLLWGGPAQKTGLAIRGAEHLRIVSSHPSPLGARQTRHPFLGSRPFSAINRWLEARGEAPIRWTL